MTFTPHPVNTELDLELIRHVPVSPQAVFDAWTNPESVKQWFAPRPYTTPLCEIDLKPGGGFRTVMNDPDGNQIDGFHRLLPRDRTEPTPRLDERPYSWLSAPVGRHAIHRHP